MEKNKNTALLILIAGLFVFTGAIESQASPNPIPVENLNLEKYVGDWYQISHIPMSFEFGGKICPCTRQRLAIESGQVTVRNTCNLEKENGPLIDIRGFAVYSDAAKSSSTFTVTLKITPTQTVVGSYWVIGIDPQYRYAVVSNDTGTSLYIISKTPTLDPLLYNEAIVIAAQQQIDLRMLRPTLQMGCIYPE